MDNTLGENNFLGSGWSFPPKFSVHTGEIALVSMDEDIRQSLTILFSTAPGERVMHPEFGCHLKKMVFETINQSTVTKIVDAIERAILFFEPRITLNAVNVDTEDSPEAPNSVYQGVLHIHLDYTIRKTNTRTNMVYPFYFAEADNVALGT